MVKAKSPKHQKSGLRPGWIGIGVSTEGLSDLAALMAAVPVDLGISYIILPHLLPSYPCRILALLNQATSMPVLLAEAGLYPQPNTVYVASSDYDTALNQGYFVCRKRTGDAGHYPSLNVLLNSLATEKQAKAMAIIISGLGSDGSAGICNIKSRGGYSFTLLPDAVPYTTMPLAAIATGHVDWVLPAEAIAEKISMMAQTCDWSTLTHDALVTSECLKKLLALTEHQENLWICIIHRMRTHHIMSFHDYLSLMQAHPEELEYLSHDLGRDQSASLLKDRMLPFFMKNSKFIVSLKDVSGRYEFINRQFENFYQITTEQILGQTDATLFAPSLAQDIQIKDLKAAAQKTPLESEDKIVLTEASERLLYSIRFALRNKQGEVSHICTQSLDTSEPQDEDNNLRLAKRVFSRAGAGILVTDAQANILTVNEAFVRLTGYAAYEVIGQNPRILASGKQNHEFYKAMWTALLNQGWWQGEIWNRRKNTEIYPEWLTITAVKDITGSITNFVGIFSDFSTVIASKSRIEFLATHDELTGLPNRSLFYDRVHQTVSRSSRSPHTFALFFVDLDDFKSINDSLGHAAGDKLLVEVTHRMRACLREGDTIARFGGDEFAILLEEATVHEADMMALRIAESLKPPHIINHHPVYPSASIGICMFPHDGTDADTLLKHADSAMYRAKETGKHHHYFFTEALRQTEKEQLDIENDLREATRLNQLFLLFQPQIDLTRNKLAGVEALVRWNHPEQGLLQPDQFMPQAQQSGLIDAISTWATLTSCQQLAHWLRLGIQLPGLSINVCGEQLRSFKLVTLMHELILELKLNKASITLEFTEAALIHDAMHMRAVLHELKSLGLRLSIDDFGTGYSSLMNLRHFALDEIKIAQSLVKDLVQSADARVVAQTVMAMAKSLGVSAVAEGVENMAQLQILQDMGCTLAQGYLFAPPLTGDELVNRFIYS